MRWYSQIFILLPMLSSFIYSQEIDTLSARPPHLNDNLLKLQIKFEEFDIYRELNYMKMDLEVNNNRNTIWMWTKLSVNNSGSIDFHPGESPGSMLEPLRQQFLENSKLNPVRYILGMAQTAAVSYLAYRHIKKYGLFK